MTNSLDLMFREPSKGDRLGSSIAQIYIKDHSTDEKGNILITPYCVSMREFEQEIDRLKQELETIKKKAKQKFTKKNK